MRYVPEGVILDHCGRQIVADGFRQYLPCSEGCGFLVGCGDAIESIAHSSCIERAAHNHHYGASAAAAPSPAPDAAEHGTGAAGGGTGVAGSSAPSSPPEERNPTLPAGGPTTSQ